MENKVCPECNKNLKNKSECPCGWKSLSSKNQIDLRCGFEKKDGREPSCLNRGIVSWGNSDDGFWQSDENKKSWEQFERIFWSGKKVICESHYEVLKQKT